MAQPTLLLTRPAPQAQRFAAEFSARFGDVPVVISPLMQIRNLPFSQGLDGVDGVILTSENAVAALGPHTSLRPPAWCVGARTKAAAEAAGFPVAGVAEDAQALANLLRTGAIGQTLLHARGRNVASDFPDRLAPAGINVTEAVTYDQTPAALNADALALLARPNPVLVPLFSPRSAFLLVEAAGPLAAHRLHIAAISPAVARAAEPLAPLRLDLASRPEAGAMLDALGRLIATLLRPHGA